MIDLSISVPDDVHDFVRKIVDTEGGYVYDPVDQGGPTKYGITIRTLSHYLGRPATQLDIETLDVETAEAIYVSEYYVLPHVYLLPEPLHYLITDMCVLHGAPTAIRLLQTTLNDHFSFELAPLHEDGVVGPATIAASQNVLAADGVDGVINTVCDEREVFVRNIVRYNPSQGKYLDGWIRRINSFRPAGEQDSAGQNAKTSLGETDASSIWRSSYAWFPVRTRTGDWVWLEKVKKRIVFRDLKFKYEYSRLDNSD